jgi:hypothetical protein
MSRFSPCCLPVTLITAALVGPALGTSARGGAGAVDVRDDARRPRNHRRAAPTSSSSPMSDTPANPGGFSVLL